jgi:hypothetical protein
MRGRVLFSLCVAMAFLLISAGAVAPAQGGEPRESAAEAERAELEALKAGILEAAHESAGAEKKELKREEGDREQARHRAGGIIIGFEGEAQVLEGFLARVRAGVDEYIEGLDMAALTIAADISVEGALEAIRGLPGVRWAEPDYLRQVLLTPDDAYVTSGDQWYLANINAYTAWDQTTGSTETTIAVLDSGIRPTHEDLAGKVLAGYDTFTGGAVTADNEASGHGTFVAGVAAADSDNTVGIAGIDWSCNIMPICVHDGTTIPDSKSVQGIKYAADNGADIINLSYGAYEYSQAEREAVDYAREKGCVVVAARGNESTDDLSFPCCLPNVIGVGSSGHTGQKSDFSDYGYGLDVLAPGVDIIGLGKASDNTYLSGDGTSFSTPLVSGQSGLILADNPGISAAELEWRIEESAQGGGTWDGDAGFGVIDMQASLALDGSGYQDSMEPNDTRKQADQAPVLDTGIYESYISCNSDLDIYRVQPEMSGYSSFVLTDIPGGSDYDLLLYRGDVNDDPGSEALVAYSLSSGNTPEFIQYPVEEGETYYLAVKSYGGYSTQEAYSLMALNPYISSDWFFAEGYTLAGFEEWLTIQNPGDTPASVEVDYMFEDGHDLRSYGVAPHSRYNIDVNKEVGAAGNVSAALYSENPIIAERPMYFDYKSKWQGGHDVMGAIVPFNYWFFAEGYTGTGFEEWLCLQNPNGFAIEATVTYMYQGGGTDVIEYGLKPLSRFTVNVNEAVGEDMNVSIMVESEDALVAERPMYFDYKGMYRGGHNVVGVNVPSSSWFFAEGCTQRGFEEWLCLQNPDETAALVTVDYMLVTGQTVQKVYSVGPTSRYTVNVFEAVGAEQDVAIKVDSTQLIVAERPMYFNYKGSLEGGHDAMGYVPGS